MGHSQFEKIQLSQERQAYFLNQQIDALTLSIDDLKKNGAEYYSIKQLEKSKKKVEEKLKKLNDNSRKDSVVTAQTEAQKSSDLFMKCRYLDELTGGKGVVFATGTPVSNSMVELYTMQRYLQYNTLEKSGLLQFDSWASTFGKTVSALELNPARNRL